MFTIPDKGEGQNDLQSILYQEYLDTLVAGIDRTAAVLFGLSVAAQGSPDMTVAVAAGIAKSGDTYYTHPGGNATITTADATNPRFDLVVLTSTGVAVRTGTPAAASVPPKPPVKTAGDVVLAVVWVPATDTTISSVQITDLRVIASPNQTVFSGETIPVAVYGDSRADTNGESNMRILGYTDMPAATFRQQAQTASIWQLQHYYPAARIVACGGVSGDTLAQMITRETAAVSATRKSLADMVAAGVKVLIMRMGINTITSTVASGAYNSSNTTSIVAAREDICRRAMSLGMIVIDEGEFGFDYVGDAGLWPSDKIANARTTIQALNTAAAAFAAASNGKCIYLPAWASVADSAGQWLTGMTYDNASPGQRVHPSTKGGQVIAKLEAQLLRSLFGVPEPNYTMFPDSDYTNQAQNATHAASSGGLATGYTASSSGTGASGTNEIVNIEGRVYQTRKAQFSGSGTNTVEINLPFAITGASPTVPVEAGDVFVIEADVLIDDGAGGPPPGPLPAANYDQYFRVAIETADAGHYIDQLIPDGLAGIAFGEAFKGRCVLGPFRMPLHSAGATNAYWRLKAACSGAVTGGNFLRIGVANPRLVRLNDDKAIPLPLLDIDELNPRITGNDNEVRATPQQTTTIGAFGVTLTNVGTVATPALATTNVKTRRHRWTIDSGTTAGNLASHRCGFLLLTRGSANVTGGFRLRTVVDLVTQQTGQRGFFGIQDSTSAATNVDPTSSTAGNKIGIGFNANTGNWRLIHNAASSAPTVTDLGTGFALGTTDAMALTIRCSPNDSGYSWKVKNLTTGRVRKGRITSNMPANTVFMSPYMWMTNNAQAASVVWGCMGWRINRRQHQ